MRIIKVEMVVSEELAADLEPPGKGKDTIRLSLNPGSVKHGDRLVVVNDDNQVVGVLTLGQK